MKLVCGIDGCRRGWVVAQRRMDREPAGQDPAMRRISSHGISVRRIEALADLLGAPTDADAFAAVAVDIPIGLADAGPRACDTEARRLLGPRRSSVFPAPVRPVLAARDYAEACALGQAADGRKISKQTYYILPKVHEVDELLRSRPDAAAVTYEVHPEVSFTLMAGGRPMQHRKRSPQGMAERMACLEAHFGAAAAAALDERKRLGCQEDDIVDALAALWTAERLAHGQAQTIPPYPQDRSLRDRFGLRMVISA